jgi:hypothetical protein
MGRPAMHRPAYLIAAKAGANACRRALRSAAPTKPNPMIINAQLPGSGTLWSTGGVVLNVAGIMKLSPSVFSTVPTPLIEYPDIGVNGKSS